MSGRLAMKRAGGRRGTILLVTLCVVFILAGLVLVFARTIRVEAIASANAVAAIQAAAVERGAEQYVLALVQEQRDALFMLSEDAFYAVPVGGDDPAHPTGWFWIIRPNYGDPELPSYGLSDEAAKININSASLDMLLSFAAMTEELAPSIVDWRDEDEDISTNGAESEFYMAMPNPYNCKNAPFESVEELLLVKGSGLDLLYGIKDSGEPNRAPVWEANNIQPLGIESIELRGLFDYLTVYSAEANTDASGQQRININDNRSQLQSLLSEQLGDARANEVIARARPPFQNIFDFYQRAGLTPDEFATIADRLTTSTQTVRRGLINVNTAPHDVLMCLPELDEDDISSLLSFRSAANLDPTNISWVAEAIPAKAAEIGDRITTRSYQYSADIVAVSANGRAFKRCRIVVDARSSPALIVYRKDLTEQGWPMERELLDELRSGEFTGGLVSSTRSGGAFR